MNKVAVIDYDAGNTLSVAKAVEYLGYSVKLTRDMNELLHSDHVIFPGVGAYYDAMKKVGEYDLRPVIDEIVSSGKPFLGICLGMQLLFDKSEETIGLNDSSVDSVEGLGILKGTIKKFELPNEYKIPHMGWNSITKLNSDSRLFKGIDKDIFVYFVHSYYLNAENRSDVAATCDYGITFDCAVEKNNIFGCQFHPEKSGDLGLRILKNFCEI